MTGTGDVVLEKSTSVQDYGTMRVFDRWTSEHRWVDTVGSLVLGGHELFGEMMDNELHDVRTGWHTVTRY